MSLVQSDNLPTHEVVARGEIAGNSSRDVTVALNKLLVAPLLSVAIVAIFHNLKPAISSSIVTSCRIFNLLHIDSTRTLVTDVDRARVFAIRRAAPFEGDCGASFGGSNKSDASLAVDTCSTLAHYKTLTGLVVEHSRHELAAIASKDLPQAMSGLSTPLIGNVAFSGMSLIRMATPSPWFTPSMKMLVKAV